MIEAIAPLNSLSLASELRKAGEAGTAHQALGAHATGAEFTSFVSNLGNTFVDNLKTAEQKSIDGILGKAGVREVVEAVMTADQTLQTAMAFRDKIVSAYLEVVKMPI
jgi:flagellar hook-basal body complex protein FliE